MADTVLPTTGLVQVEVGASEDTWGAKLNTNLELIDGLFVDASGAPALLLASGGTGATDAATARTNLGLGAAATATGAKVAFTPVMTSGAGSPTFVYTAQQGYYTEIGGLRFVAIRVVLSSKGAGGSGQVFITGLPIAASGVRTSCLVSAWESASGLSDQEIKGWVEAGETRISLRKQSPATGNPLLWSDIDDLFAIDLAVTYFSV